MREVLWETGQALLSRNIEHSLAAARAGKEQPALPLDVVAQYLAGAFVNLLKWWLEADARYTPEEMEEIFQKLAMPGVWAAIGANGRMG
jgi:hypothetical protein